MNEPKEDQWNLIDDLFSEFPREESGEGEFPYMIGPQTRAALRAMWDYTEELESEIGRLRLYEQACESMASQFICPRMTGEELARKQVEGTDAANTP